MASFTYFRFILLDEYSIAPCNGCTKIESKVPRDGCPWTGVGPRNWEMQQRVPTFLFSFRLGEGKLEINIKR